MQRNHGTSITPAPIVLASQSPRRVALLRAAGIAFDVCAVEVDESLLDGEAPDAYVTRLARDKAEAGQRQHPGRVVLGADTTVVIDGRVLGKPRDPAEATGMLRALSGRVHHVLTGVALAGPSGTRVGLETTAVTFRPLGEDEIARYVAGGEPMDKAGAYAIQGGAAPFVTEVSQSYTNVVGLPVALVCRLLLEYSRSVAP